MLNRGFSGYNSRLARTILDLAVPPRDADAPRALFATLFFGANDMASWHLGNEHQEVPLAEYAANLRAIVEELKTRAEHVLLITPPAVDNARWPNRTNEAASRYAAAGVALAAELGVHVADLYSAMIAMDASSSAAGAAAVSESDASAADAAACGGGGGGGAADGSEVAAPSTPAYFSLLSDGLHFNAAGGAFVYDLVHRTLTARCPEVLPSRIATDIPTWREACAVAAGEPERRGAALFTPEALAAFRASEAAHCPEGPTNGGDRDPALVRESLANLAAAKAEGRVCRQW